MLSASTEDETRKNACKANYAFVPINILISDDKKRIRISPIKQMSTKTT